MSMETQYVEKGGAPKLFRKPTKPPTKSRDYLSRNTLGNGGRAKKPRLSESGQRSTRTKTSETRAVPNIRRAPTNAVNRRRTKSRTRKENSFVDQVSFVSTSFISLMSECGAAEAKEDRDKRWASWKQPKKSNR